MTDTVRVFIGRDAREMDAYAVCEASIRRLSSVPVDIQPVDRISLGTLYRRPTRRDADGQLWDEVGEPTPMSTDFSLARFFVPYLCGFAGFAIFVDCDFLFRRDIADLWALRDERYAVQVVKHCYYVRDGRKMDGRLNPAYPRKNWSSLILWNCGHQSVRRLTPEFLNEAKAASLHRFAWLRDDEIGQLPFEWNWLALDPAAVHFTYGVPTMPGYENEPFADEWVAVYNEVRPTREADTGGSDGEEVDSGRDQEAGPVAPRSRRAAGQADP